MLLTTTSNLTAAAVQQWHAHKSQPSREECTEGCGDHIEEEGKGFLATEGHHLNGTQGFTRIPLYQLQGLPDEQTVEHVSKHSCVGRRQSQYSFYMRIITVEFVWKTEGSIHSYSPLHMVSTSLKRTAELPLEASSKKGNTCAQGCLWRIYHNQAMPVKGTPEHAFGTDVSLSLPMHARAHVYGVEVGVSQSYSHAHLST